MQNILLASAIALAVTAPLATAGESSTGDAAYPAATTVAEYSSSRTERRVDEDGNVIEESETYQSDTSVPAAPDESSSSSSSSTTTTYPDGSQSTTTEEQRTEEDSYTGTTTVEKRRSTVVE